MDRVTLRQTLIDLLETETGNRPATLDDDVVLAEGLGLDSIDLVSLVVQVENKVHVKITTDELKPVQTVGHLLDLLQAKTALTTPN